MGRKRLSRGVEKRLLTKLQNSLKSKDIEGAIKLLVSYKYSAGESTRARMLIKDAMIEKLRRQERYYLDKILVLENQNKRSLWQRILGK